MGIHLEVKVLS